MAIKIQNKIVGYEVVKEEEEAALREKDEAEKEERKSATIIRMTEAIERPEGMESLEGSTYKIKTPLDDHAMYVTINDIVLNAGTEHEQRRPFEIFINSKNLDHYQWIVALTRIISAVFRKGGDVTFLVEELKAVFAKIEPGSEVQYVVKRQGGKVKLDATLTKVPGRMDFKATRAPSWAITAMRAGPGCSRTWRTTALSTMSWRHTSP